MLRSATYKIRAVKVYFFGGYVGCNYIFVASFMSDMNNTITIGPKNKPIIPMVLTPPNIPKRIKIKGS